MMKAKKTPTESKRTAEKQLMDLLSKREHSELELQEKLLRKFPEDEVQQALSKAKAKGWVPATAEDEMDLSQRTAETLHRRKKGALWINQFLIEKGLPEIPVDEDAELAKALQLIQIKFRTQVPNEELLAKMMRFLNSRGFPTSVIRKAIEQWKN